MIQQITKVTLNNADTLRLIINRLEDRKGDSSIFKVSVEDYVQCTKLQVTLSRLATLRDRLGHVETVPMLVMWLMLPNDSIRPVLLAPIDKDIGPMELKGLIDSIDFHILLMKDK